MGMVLPEGTPRGRNFGGSWRFTNQGVEEQSHPTSRGRRVQRIAGGRGRAALLPRAPADWRGEGPPVGNPLLAAAQKSGRLCDLRQLLLGHERACHRAVREGREAAVGRQQDALGSERLDGAASAGRDRFGWLHLVHLLVDNAYGDPPVGGHLPQHVDLAGARRAELEEERAHLDRLEEWEEGTIVT